MRVFFKCELNLWFSKIHTSNLWLINVTFLGLGYGGWLNRPDSGKIIQKLKGIALVDLFLC